MEVPPNGQQGEQQQNGVVTPPPDQGGGDTTQVQPPAQGAQSTQQGRGGGNVITIPSESMGRIKKEERAKGKREAMADLDSKAKAAGFSSLDEAFGALAALKSGGGQQQQPQQQRQQQRGNGNGQQQRHAQQSTQPQDRQARKTQEQVDRERRQRLKAEREARDYREKLDAEQARMQLEREAWGKGIRDTDYAIQLFTRHCEQVTAGKSDAEAQQALQSVDEGAFFDGLRKTHPYLYGEVTVPATTGVDGSATPPKPPTAAAATAAGGAAPVDVRKMSKQEYDEHLRKQGLTPPTHGAY